MNMNIDLTTEVQKCASIDIEWDKLEKKTILVTGATGLIGTYFINVLLQRNLDNDSRIKIIALGRDEQKFFDRFKDYNKDQLVFLKHDIQVPLTIDEHIDYIIHMASNTHPRLYAAEPIATEMTNILGTYNLLNLAAENKGCRFLLMSSTDIYGNNNDKSKAFLKENDFGYVDCNTLRAGYIEGKRASEALCNAFKEEKGLDFVTARVCRTFGPTMRLTSSLAVSQFILNAVEGKDITLKSKGNQIFSFLYVYDVVSALFYLITNGLSGNAYNVADKSQTLSLLNLAQCIADVSGTKVCFDLPDELEKKGASSFENVCLDSEKLESLGWKSEVSLKDGIERTIKYLKSLS